MEKVNFSVPQPGGQNLDETQPGGFCQFAGFYRLVVKIKRVADPLVYCDQADLKRYRRLKNQSASIDASGSAVFFPVSEHPKKKTRRVGVNKRNRGYPADFEFIERLLRPFLMALTRLSS